MDDHEEETCAPLLRAETIARLNDRLRQRGEDGTIAIMRGIMSLPGFEAITLTYELATTAASMPTTIRMENATLAI